MKKEESGEWTVYTFRKSFKNETGELKKEGTYEFKVKTKDERNWSTQFDMIALNKMPSEGIAEFMKALQEAKETIDIVERAGKPKK